MKAFYVLLVLTFILGLMSRIYLNEKNKPYLIWTVAIMTLFIVVAGLRNGIGDTGMYKELYRNIVMGNIQKGAYEVGFVFLLQILASISTDPQFMIFMTSLITQGINIWMFRQYSSLYELQLYMYIASGYFLTSMNGIRQALVAAVIFAATPLIIKGKFKTYLVIVLIMSTFHSSILIMIPVYFVVRVEAWSPKMMKILMISAVLLVFGKPLIELGLKMLEGSRYEGYVEFDEGGSNIFRTVVAAVPVVFSYLQRNILKEKWPQGNVFINMSIVNMLISGLSMYNWIFARFNYYFQLYSFVLMPYCIKYLDDKKQKRFIYYSFIVLYFGFMYFEYVVSMNIRYTSDYIF